MFAQRRAVRNGSVWIEHSLSFRGRERLFIADERREVEARRHYARLQMPAKAENCLAPLLERVRAGVDAVPVAVRTSALRVDDELHLAPLAADDEGPEVTKLRSRLDQRIGEVQLPEAKPAPSNGLPPGAGAVGATCLRSDARLLARWRVLVRGACRFAHRIVLRKQRVGVDRKVHPLHGREP